MWNYDRKATVPDFSLKDDGTFIPLLAGVVVFTQGAFSPRLAEKRPPVAQSVFL